jgi:hypothetical protein
MSISNSIVQGYSSIDRVHSIERERERIQSSKEFRDWCSKYNIGSRIESRDVRATELMNQYSDRYSKWVKSI